MCVVVSILCDGVSIIKKPGKSLSIIIELLTVVVLRMIVDGPKQGNKFQEYLYEENIR